MANDDKNLDEYLEGKSELSQRYRELNNAEPPSVLDEKILSASKQAVSNIDNETRKYIRKPNWAKPVSIAAVITLSVSLVISMQQETGQPLLNKPIIESYDLPESKDVSIPDKQDASAEGFQRKRLEATPEPSIKSIEMMDSLSVEEAIQQPEDEFRKLQSAKKVLKKEKAASVNEEEEILMDQVMSASPAELNVLSATEAVGDMNQPDKILMEIKSLWSQGKKEEAKTMFSQFIQDNPEYTQDVLEKILGEEIMQFLHSEQLD